MFVEVVIVACVMSLGCVLQIKTKLISAENKNNFILDICIQK